MSQLYMAYRIMSNKSCMKKSEKIKGKEAVAARKKSRFSMELLRQLALFLLPSSGLYCSTRLSQKQVIRCMYFIPGHWMMVPFLTQT